MHRSNFLPYDAERLITYLPYTCIISMLLSLFGTYSLRYPHPIQPFFLHVCLYVCLYVQYV